MNFLDAEFIKSAGLVLGGLALFIYGIDSMSDGLKSIAGSKIRDYIEKYTSNLFMAVLVGTIVTGALQSSTASTVISIGLVRAGLMKLEQAIGITIGANIGSCFTSIMIGMNIEDYAYYIIFIGVCLMLLAKKKKWTYLGKVFLGFGLLFAGLQIMGDELIEIADTAMFNDAMVFLGENPWLALLGGTLATAVLQSSAAVVGIVQKLFTTGIITPVAGAAFIFGSNVGTTLTAIIAGAGGTVSSRRAAWFHAVYNIVGAILGMILMVPFLWLVDWINSFIQGSPEMWIAQAHLIFNILSTVLILPFVGYSVKLLKMLIPGEDRQGAKIESIDNLDFSLIETLPAAALEVSRKNTLRMGRNTSTIMDMSKRYLESKSSEDYDEIQEVEATVNKYDETLSKYLSVIVQQQNLAKDQTKEYSRNYVVVKNLERISDLSVVLSQFYKLVFDEKERFSTTANTELHKMYSLLEEMLPAAMNVYADIDKDENVARVGEIHLQLKELEDGFRDSHFDRIVDYSCKDQVAASIYVDILSNLMRMGEHMLNIVNNSVSKSQVISKHVETEAITA
ncbi:MULTISPECIES: Na/Pi cotransporter family protein [unclassified Breznakia]|uniref:Na/Pi cotransporter family protein n=1 Tax=unclassified Breznakia TaxID=2623764 RepID=UPI0024737B9B|nr:MULTISPECIES: Na/Pi cotransporter family protein [unclassified Breznakia]MDH6367490.1 phosphate:Na+ symporter [Breznakia sp. PH1-1]MDH6404610.1 phosphate:Na+ symporter [Breznakia sp. PF1-11]MDH6412319.1 phosphate:Na+ symporter [Breznakia sp. PFB1-11]MDH6414657.1 phosphate:Na+ symporter [Breznakia sp. PFB1-14]MDH6416948.1 phosphate:Na+ symporter [Breznakia sp. PFB1-4]